jgi:hypothetical protein
MNIQLYIDEIKVYNPIFVVARSSVVGWGTMLQAWKSRVQVPKRWNFSIYLIFPATLWPRVRLSF